MEQFIRSGSETSLFAVEEDVLKIVENCVWVSPCPRCLESDESLVTFFQVFLWSALGGSLPWGSES